ncbi:hypothetical protein [Mycolicibacterium duvalii]|nr:hypothetical protein [Mycolicibacterium duvalii]
MWWPVAVVGVTLLVAAIAVAALVRTKGTDRQRLQLANTIRLTRLPEYRSVVRRQLQATVLVLVLAIPLFVAAVLAGARPTEPVLDATGSQRRADIMLCVAAPVTDESTGTFLSYFADRVSAYDAERIGLTSTNRRVIPLTRDYQFAAGRLGDYAQPSAAGNQRPAFSPAVEYGDYSPSVADVLALCLTGFPDFETRGDTQRSVVYLGPGELGDDGDDGVSLYSADEVAEMARQAGARIDAVATPGRSTAVLSSVTAATGGQFARLDPARLPAQLDGILTDLRESDETAERRDAPAVLLAVAAAVTALLGVALMAVRR